MLNAHDRAAFGRLDPRLGRPRSDAVDTLLAMDRPPPDPNVLLEHWEGWERGEVPPGQTLAELKKHGLAELLSALAITDQDA